MAFAFALAAQTCAVLLIFQNYAQFFPGQTPAAAVLSLSLGTPILYNLVSPSIYETAIIAGQFFLLAGLLAAWLALKGRQPRLLWLAAAGACWSLAAGSRISLPPAIAALTLITLWHACRCAPNISGKCSAALGLLLPMATILTALAWYNFARFGSIWESGQTYQLNRINQPGMWATGFISPANILPNAIVCLFMPPAHTRGFPYLLAVARQPALGRFFAIRQRFITQPIVGLAWTQPFLILSLFAIPWRRPPALSLRAADASPLNWLRAALIAGGLLAAAAPLSINYTAMRYLLDVVPCLSILAAIGHASLLQRLSNRPRRAAELRAAARIVVALQFVVAVLLTIARFPALAHALAAHLPVF